MFALDLVLALLGLPVLACAGYLLLLTALSRRLRVPAGSTPKLRFRVLIPAHDETLGIAATVQNLLALDYPRELFDVQVIADNCADDTAAKAREAGAQVLERHDEAQRGKGYALHYAFERLPADVDAAVVVDADTVVSPNLLRAFAARLEAGAAAVQADYAVRNPGASWRTRLMAVAFGAFHIVRSRGRERLRVSAGLRGNGMCFSARVLREVPHEAYSIVEDVEYGIRLAEAGHRVFYADEAHVYGEMVSGAKAARSQRSRWEGGRKALTQKYGVRLLKEGLRGNRVLLDLAADVLVPPLSKVAVSSVAGAVVAFAAAALTGGGFVVSRAVFGASVVAVVAYVIRGWAVSGTGMRGLVDLALAPVYVVWKSTVSMRAATAPQAEWIRTRRERDTTSK
ncbi:MAG TPA: glycosyltransferase family 2 protein [Polyangiaceae bacterium]|nr:glycosyltransferase family 2 protein [Polyangiaceae bacterium]